MIFQKYIKEKQFLLTTTTITTKTMVILKYVFIYMLLDIHEETESIGNMDATSKEELEKDGNHYLFFRIWMGGKGKQRKYVSKILKPN